MGEQQQKPTKGRTVFYVLPSARSAGQARPAVVVQPWGGPDELCNLVVFLDGSNDAGATADQNALQLWATSARHDEVGKAPGTWHWPPRA